MGERKVLNKYFPPDFDPSALPKSKRVRSEDKQMKVRMMLPMSVRCNTCGTYMYKGTKFNTRMEDVRGEAYLGIKIFRFYYRCTSCSAEFCMKTDPQHSDYTVEAGASRNYEPWRENERAEAEAQQALADEEKGNAIRALENRTAAGRREMDALAALGEVRALRARHAALGEEAALGALREAADAEDRARAAEARAEAALEEDDARALRELQARRAGVVRLQESSSEDDEGRVVQGRGAGRSGGRDSDDGTEQGVASASGRALGGLFARPTSGKAARSVAASAWEEEGGVDGDDAAQAGKMAGAAEEDSREGNGKEGVAGGIEEPVPAGGSRTGRGEGAGVCLDSTPSAPRAREHALSSAAAPAPKPAPSPAPVPSLTASFASGSGPRVVLAKKAVPAMPVPAVAGAPADDAMLALAAYGSDTD